MKWLFITLVSFHVAAVLISGQTAEPVDYLECTLESDFHPGVCDCTATEECVIRLTVTNRFADDELPIDEWQLFSVNGGRIGPTIIAKYNQLIVADVYNEIDKSEINSDNVDLSMHWHGMHQFNTDWMDGVGMITQWPTKPDNAFRYVFRAHPGGTHWYHSHHKEQRDEGILGALIVQDDDTVPNGELLANVVDNPEKAMLVIRDQITVVPEHEKMKKYEICEPDRSQYSLFPFYGYGVTMETFSINGVKLDKKLPDSTPEMDLKPIFYVKKGESFRFRILGIMVADAIRISIDKHKLHVMSTDGYLTEQFPTDFLVFHIAERYDFILSATEDYDAGTVFPIRIETIAVECDDHTTPKMVSYAYLQYTKNDEPEKSRSIERNDDRCAVDECTALNCPFGSYHPNAKITCHDATELCLLNPTPHNQLPKHDENVVERFLNFAPGGSMINGIKNKLPEDETFSHAGQTKVVNECVYGDRDVCGTFCPHALYLRNDATGDTFTPQTIRLVLSSIVKEFDKSDPNVGVHPIHLHGHSFFVTKIGYPLYDNKNAIDEMNPDLTQPDSDCGPAKWTSDERPSGIEINNHTVRKDVVIVPAGGYVVIEFLADNPGWWFLHCHIDRHMNNGMAIAISELPDCQTCPKNDAFSVTDSFSDSKTRYLIHEADDKCKIKEGEPNVSIRKANQAREKKKKSDRNTAQNLHQKKFGSAVTNDGLPYWRWRASPYHKRGLYHMLKAIGRQGR